MARFKLRRCGLAAVAAVALTAPAAPAAPTEQRVRIEGRAATLFEGPILTRGHAVRAASDSTPRRCDGTNNAAHSTPGATPTAAADDAMRLAGQGFDAQWYPGFDDYFIQQFGPDRQDDEAYHYWGILVNGIYTSVGGCQYRLNAGDVALWVFDAFTNRNLLRLDGPTGHGEPTADAEGGPPTAPDQQVFTVGLGEPFAVTTVENQATGDIGAPGFRRPAAGVAVAPVATGSDGVQTVLTGDPATVATGEDGRATLSWSVPGWKRIKADRAGHVRSNRLDICVRTVEGGDCGPLPPDVAVRSPVPARVPEPPPTPQGSGSLATAQPQRAPVVVGASTIGGLRITTDGHATALVGVRWTISGAPLRAWRIDYRQRGIRSRKWRRAATGTVQSSVLLDLPVGRFADLRIRLTAADGSTTTRPVGTVAVPVDDRLRSMRFRGNWARDRDPLAWRQTLTRMRRGASLRTTVRSGRPTLVLRSDRRPARILLRTRDGRTQRRTVPGHRDGRTVLVSGRRQGRSGRMEVRVLSGVVRVDGMVARD